MKRQARTMLRLSRGQKSLAAEKLADLANLAAAALVFGQVATGAALGWASALAAAIGVVLWLVLMLFAIAAVQEAHR
jgi:fatty acid desaturase